MLTFLLAVVLFAVLVTVIIQIAVRRSDPHHSFALSLLNLHLGGATVPTTYQRTFPEEIQTTAGFPYEGNSLTFRDGVFPPTREAGIGYTFG